MLTIGLIINPDIYAFGLMSIWLIESLSYNILFTHFGDIIWRRIVGNVMFSQIESGFEFVIGNEIESVVDSPLFSRLFNHIFKGVYLLVIDLQGRELTNRQVVIYSPSRFTRHRVLGS